MYSNKPPGIRQGEDLQAHRQLLHFHSFEDAPGKVYFRVGWWHCQCRAKHTGEVATLGRIRDYGSSRNY